MKTEKVRLQTVAGRVVERSPDGAVGDSIINKQEAVQLLTCQEGEQIKIVTKKGDYTFGITAERQGSVFLCFIKERNEDNAIAEYYCKYLVADIEKVAASSSKQRKETALTAVNLERGSVRKLKKLTRRLKTQTQKESFFWVAGMTEESRHRFLTSNGFKVVNGEVVHPRARENHQDKLLEYRKAAAGRGWWRIGPAERRRAERKWYR